MKPHLVPAGAVLSGVTLEPVSIVATADLAALESRAAELEAALRALVEAMPRCTAVIDNHIGARCGKPATRAWGRGGDRYCDNHGSYVGGLVGQTHAPPDYPRAAPLRAALLLLAKGD